MHEYSMTNRTLAHTMMSDDGSHQQVINYSNLEGFQLETVQRFNELTPELTAMKAKMETTLEMLRWIGRHHPEAITNYHTTKAVVNRLEDSNYISEADMKQEMQVTP